MAITDDLTAYWVLDETGTNNRVDKIDGHILTDVDSKCARVAGKSGGAVDFNGTDAYLRANDHNDYSVTGDFSIAFWATWHPVVVGVDRIISKYEVIATVNRIEYQILMDDAQLRFYIYNDPYSAGDWIGSTSNIFTPYWHFVVCMYDSVNKHMYLKFDQDAMVDKSTSIVVGNTPARLHLGSARGASNFANAAVCDFGFWKRLLTTDEIDYLYNDGIGQTWPLTPSSTPSAVVYNHDNALYVPPSPDTYEGKNMSVMQDSDYVVVMSSDGSDYDDSTVVDQYRRPLNSTVWTKTAAAINDTYDDMVGGGGVIPATGTWLCFVTHQEQDFITNAEYCKPFRNTNQGTSWVAGTAITPPGAALYRYFAHGSVLELPSGKLLQAFWGDDDSSRSVIWVMSSTDDGATWGSAVTILDTSLSNAPQWPDMVILDTDGTDAGTEIFLAYTYGASKHIYGYSSKDGGATWNSLGHFGRILNGANGAIPTVYDRSGLSVVEKDGWVWLGYTNRSNEAWVAVSRANGLEDDPYIFGNQWKVRDHNAASFADCRHFFFLQDTSGNWHGLSRDRPASGNIAPVSSLPMQLTPATPTSAVAIAPRAGLPLTSGMSRVFIAERHAGAPREPVYYSTMVSGALEQDVAEFTNVTAVNPATGRDQIIGQTRGSGGYPTLSLRGRYAADMRSEMLRIAKKECASDIHLHFGYCTVPSVFDEFSKAIIVEGAHLVEWASTELGAIESGDRAVIDEEVSITARNFYEVLPLHFSTPGQSLIQSDLLDVITADLKDCGNCGNVASDGCQKTYVLANASTDPTVAYHIMYSPDGAITWYSVTIGTLSTDVPTAIMRQGDYFMVVTEEPSLHYSSVVSMNNITSGTAPNFTELTTGFVSGSKLTACWANDKLGYIAAEDGYVYSIENPQDGPTTLHSGTVTTANLSCIHSPRTAIIVAGGATGTFIYSTNGGTDWGLATAPSASTINCVWAVNSKTFWAGDAGGKLWLTTDQGSTWEERGFSGSGGSGVVEDIFFSSRSVGYMIHSKVDAGNYVAQFFRTYNGGHTWVLLPETVTGESMPNSGRLYSVSGCKHDVNRVVAVGDGAAGIDPAGIIIRGIMRTDAG